MLKFLKKYADMKALNKYGVKSSDLKTLAGALMNEGKLTEATASSKFYDQYDKYSKAMDEMEKIIRKHTSGKSFTAFQKAGQALEKVMDRMKIVEGKLTEAARAMDWIEQYGEIGQIHKVRGRAAYVKFPSTSEIAFDVIDIQTLKKTGKKHKGKDLYLSEGKVNEATATIALSQEDMDKLHGDGSIDVDGVTITYQEPTNPQPQDEGKLNEAKNFYQDIVDMMRGFRLLKIQSPKRYKELDQKFKIGTIERALTRIQQYMDRAMAKGFIRDSKLNERGNMRKGDFVDDGSGNIGIITKMMGYTAYVKYTNSKRGTSSQQRGLTPVFNDDVDDTRKKHKGKTLWREV